ncbi:MAG TPA: TolC family protein [Bacteroidia bacterium]|nr:TolC family protein [Bacteroidia bacterium]
MKNTQIKMHKTYLMLLLALLSFEFVSAQTYSLQQAQDYAVKNSISSANAKLDVDLARAKKNEITGIGLPQVSGSFDIKDYLELPTQLLPGDFMPGGVKGTFIPVQFGTKYNSTMGISVSQLLFSSDYLVGLQASKTYMELAKKAETSSKIETMTSVAKAYYGVLVAKERFKLLDANIERLEKMLSEMNAMFKSGYIEKIDVDRVEVNYNNLLVEKEKTQRLINLSEALLKFQMGIDVNQKIELSDSLGTFLNNLNEQNIGKVNPSSRIEYSLLETQNKLNELDLKRYRLSYLPNLAAYGSFSKQAQRAEFDIFDPSLKWYPISLIGVTLNVPIFDGLQTSYKTEQAKITLLKSKNTLDQLQRSINLETNNTSTAYTNSLATLKLQKKNIELAERVYQTTKIKYDQGVGSNLEVINAQASYREALVNYYAAIYDALVSKTDLDKALGNIK